MSDRYGGPLGWLRRWNHERRERRRLAREALEALAADDRVIMEALSRLLALHARLDARLDAIEAAAGRPPQAALGAGALPGPPAVATARDALLEPELDLARHLARSLEPRVALEVGARDGRLAGALAELGFAVHTAEAAPAALASLAGDAPALVHVDGGGPALDAVAALRPAVLVAAFREDAAPEAAVRVRDLVARARRTGAPWHLVVFRRPGDAGASFYGGLSDAPERSSGKVFFFADRARYEDALAFLDGAVPRARFVRPASGPA